MSARRPRTEIVVAVIGAAAVVVAAIVSGVFSGDSPTQTAEGHNGRVSDSCVAGGVIVNGTVNCAAQKSGPAGAGALRLGVQPLNIGFFHVAFARDPGLPAETDRYPQLLAEGGADIDHSTQLVTFANRSDQPLTITQVQVEVVASTSPPTAALAYQFSQGSSTLTALAARLDNQNKGDVADIYAVKDNLPGYAADPPGAPYFQNRFIKLAPGEIYEARITVAAPQTYGKFVEYRFLISGETASRRFEIASAQHGRVTGPPPGAQRADPARYDHTYIDGYLSFMQAAPGCAGIKVHAWYEQPKDARAGDCSQLPR